MPVLAVPNVTAHQSTASVQITVLLYNGPLLWGCDMPIERLRVKLKPKLKNTEVQLLEVAITSDLEIGLDWLTLTLTLNTCVK